MLFGRKLKTALRHCSTALWENKKWNFTSAVNIKMDALIRMTARMKPAAILLDGAEQSIRKAPFDTPNSFCQR
jgi:hypothetical protein